MKKNIVFSTIAIMTLSIGIVSCKKSKDDAANPTTPSAKNCKTSYAVTDEDSTVFIYDAQDRLTKMEYYALDKTPQGSRKYDYTSGKIVDTYYDEKNTPGNSVSYYLNSNGTANYSTTTHSASSPTNGTGTSYDTTYYTYDSEGYNTKQITKTTFKGMVGYDTIVRTFSNGNKITETQLGPDGDVTTYVYNSTEDKTIFSSDSPLPGLLGKESKNLLVSFKNQDNTLHGTVTYEVNADGYVTRYMPSYVSPFGTDSYDYHISYTCK